ncbi:CHASE2 domain-containing protein [Hyalangium minutum]|uniref:Adenylate cyclase n=1 Tax=Hyalangium minutum TaxID=394096 RepID=A0A085WAJ8_9BACT|nr:adenylate/guanylate cyclase domain-containing protein [Hyalangium minutum]KFE64711.1 Adenylate cyclase [Hyalangium minutum]
MAPHFRMKNFLSRHRFEVLALGLAVLFGFLHVWVDDAPVIGSRVDDKAAPLLIRALQAAEGRITDLQFALRGRRPAHPDVVVVAVDEKSAQRYGLWPWPRDLLARAMDRLREAGAGAVGLDMIFADEVVDRRAQAYAGALEELDRALSQGSPESAAALAAYREELSRRAAVNTDSILAASLNRFPQVVQGIVVYPPKERARFASKAEEWTRLLEPHLIREFPGEIAGSSLTHKVDLATLRSWRMDSAQLPLSLFAEASRHLGFFNSAVDPDGTLRRMPLFALLERPRGLAVSLELQTAAAYLGAQVEPVADPAQNQIIGARFRRPDGKLLPLRVPLPHDEPFWLINYPGPASSFVTLSLSDVVDGAFDPAAVRGKAVLVGVTLVGNYDQRVTPFNEFESGVYIHAAALSNILSQDFLFRPQETQPLELLFMLGTALLLARLLPRVRFAWKLGSVALLITVWLVVDQVLFTRGIQVATVMPLVSLITSAFAVIFLGYFSVDAEKAQLHAEKARLRKAFQHYLDASVMEQVLAHPDKLKLGGERKELSVLFSDIRGFTTLSEHMTPEQLVSFINQYLTPMTDVVFAQGGTLDKYIGDAIMAFWGAPVDQPDHAVRACAAALGFLEKLSGLRARWRAAGLPEMDIGVGISSGLMNVGHMGTENRFNYTVMGDAVNLASRLEGLNKAYDTRILISADTYAQARGHIAARRLGVVRVKGKREPTDIYELRAMGTPVGPDAEAIQAFEAGVACFLARDFSTAEIHFRQVVALWPEDGPSLRYLEEINTLKWNRPGPDWDGVFTATTK